jgi:3-dehydroquinate synthetase
VTQELHTTLEALDLSVELPNDIEDEALIALTAHDKKAEAGEARFVLAERLGKVALRAVPLEIVRAGLQAHRRRHNY